MDVKCILGLTKLSTYARINHTLQNCCLGDLQNFCGFYLNVHCQQFDTLCVLISLYFADVCICSQIKPNKLLIVGSLNCRLYLLGRVPNEYLLK